ncbi:uncharacterized protein LODBEIA_P10590 [Lodderomyces beijingensis]|uniref:Cullin family profile domain-containing protein n=1 Tax=Lodderomyces beijingensis TaxID=1775926 RepID=A0ABP0ZF91_9ASCO
MTPAGGRRSKIRPPRKSLISSSHSDANSTDPTIDFDKNWAILQNAISQIQNKNVSNLSYEQLYRKAYVLVIRKFGEKLYGKVSEAVTEHLLSERQKLLALSTNAEGFIQALTRQWDEHLQSMKFIEDVLMYLNRVYVKEQKRLEISDLGVHLFKENIIMYNNNEIGSLMDSIILDEIRKSRNGVVVTSNIYTAKVIGMMEQLTEHGTSADIQYGESYYQTIFEPLYLSSSDLYFQELSKSFLASNSGSKYLQSVTRFIKDEEIRLKNLPVATHAKLTSLMDNILIKDKVDSIIQSPVEGLDHWFKPVLSNAMRDGGHDNYHFQDLKLLFNLVGRIDDEYQILRSRLKDTIISQGNMIPELIKNSLESSEKKPSSMNAASFATKWIDYVLKYKSQMMEVWKQSFDQDLSVEQTLTLAMRDFINNNNSKRGNVVNAPELLSVYMDYNIKQIGKGSVTAGVSGQAGDELNNLIEDSLQILKFVKDKDAFEAYYANHFARRFLNSKTRGASQSKGLDIEEMVLSKLCEEMGNTSLDKVIKMSKDIKISTDTTKAWKKHLSKPNGSTAENLIDLDLKICNVTVWPNALTKDYKNFESGGSEFVWPRQLRETIREFEEFWSAGKKNDNKSLHWSPKFGSVDMRISYPSRTYDINLSVFAAIIMLLFAPSLPLEGDEEVSAFSEKKQFSCKEIQQLTGIPEQELKRHLQSIAVAPKSRLLVKSPMSKDVNEHDTFRLNEKFKSPSTKVKVLTVSMASSSSSSSSSSSTSALAAKRKDEEADEVNSHIVEGRKIELNAAIVRILKSRRTVSHNELIEGVIRQLTNRFQPSIVSIKQRIEDLIEKEYLERDAEDRNLYHYIA